MINLNSNTPLSFTSYAKFPFLEREGQMKHLIRDLKTYSYNETWCDKLHEKALISALKNCLDTSLKTQHTFNEALSLKNLASEIKRNSLRHDFIWQSLDSRHHTLLNALETLTLDPTVPTTDLEHIGLHNINFIEANANFGDGYVLGVSAPRMRGLNYEFKLTQSPNLSVYKYTKPSEQEKALERHTSLAQIAVFNVPVNPSFAIQPKGIWEVNYTSQPVPLSKISFDELSADEIDQLAEDIAIYLTTEEMWNINLLGKDPQPGEDVFALQNKRCVSWRTIHQPELLTQSFAVRKEKFLTTLKLYPKLWKSLSTKFYQTPLQKHISQEIEQLLLHHPDSEKILKQLDQSRVLKALINQTTEKTSSLESLQFYGYLSLLDVPEIIRPSIPYTYSEEQSAAALELFETQEKNNKRFYSAMLALLVHTFEYQDDFESQVMHVMKQAESIFSSIGQWLDNQPELAALQIPSDGYQLSPKNHFWARLAEPFLIALQNEMQSQAQSKCFYEKLTLLRYISQQEPSLIPQANVELSKVIQHRIMEQQSLELLQLVQHAAQGGPSVESEWNDKKIPKLLLRPFFFALELRLWID